MSKSLTLGSFFDGIGGWLLAAKHAGVNPVWASEIDDFPATVSAHHFPQVKQLGDITKINVDELEPTDIICAGSPCQDLSVAGKREGLTGERSGLFRTAIKLVHRLRARTGKPRFFVWENVPGAFSSNGGADFRTVLEEIGQTEIPMPERNKWATSGMVQCDQCEIAWRVLDAQYWGVPQRRKRIFLVADFATTDRRAAEVLFVEPCLSRDTAEGEGTGQEDTGNVGESVDSAVVRMRSGCAGGGKGPLASNEKSLTLATSNDQTLFTNIAGTLTSWDVQSKRIQAINGTAAALSTGGGRPGQGYPCVACYDISHRKDVIRHQEKGTSPYLTARAGTGGNNLPVVHSYCIAGNTIDRKPQNGGNGTGNQEELSYTLNTMDRHAVVSYASQSYTEWKEGEPRAALRASGGFNGGGSENLATYNGGAGQNNTPLVRQVVGSLCARDYKGIGNQDLDKLQMQSHTVRRLTPLECERLQGLPDGYTDIEFNGKPAPDSRRYKAIGNGMAQPCADFVIRRIAEVVSNGA